ncbi:MAG TPA: LptA/OstA family protein [Woeseiaceae bacterium]|nr:LptA/OstA family protein [Woeseiaceae bacterium]
MNASNRQCRGIPVLLMAALLAAAAPGAGAQEPDSQLPISMDADSFDYDGKTSMLMYRGLRLTQGNIAVQADEGRASSLDFENSTWHLAGNVVIDVRNGHVESETADLTFRNHQLQTAVITGSPAIFRMQRPGRDVTTYAEAGRLVYDFSGGIVEFSESATITEGGNRISSDYLVYNIEEQRIKAQSGAEGDSKVKITYTPEDPAKAPGDGEAAEDSADEDDPENKAGGQ